MEYETKYDSVTVSHLGQTLNIYKRDADLPKRCLFTNRPVEQRRKIKLWYTQPRNDVGGDLSNLLVRGGLQESSVMDFELPLHDSWVRRRSILSGCFRYSLFAGGTACFLVALWAFLQGRDAPRGLGVIWIAGVPVFGIALFWKRLVGTAFDPDSIQASFLDSDETGEFAVSIHRVHPDLLRAVVADRRAWDRALARKSKIGGLLGVAFGVLVLVATGWKFFSDRLPDLLDDILCWSGFLTGGAMVLAGILSLRSARA